MGEVYRARDSRLGRDVAIKILPASLTNEAARLKRFEQEARSVAALNHPNILTIYEIETQDGSPYLVSELLEGETLQQRLRESAIPVRKALDIAVQTAHGIAAAHEKGIVHRDLKPANIFITADGRVKILDFGLAKLTQPDTAANTADGQTVTRTNAMQAGPVTEEGVVLGTAGYMSPEQVRGKPADSRSDIFALGTILYEMLSGHRAFQRDSSADTMAAILKEDPPSFPAKESRSRPESIAWSVTRWRKIRTNDFNPRATSPSISNRSPVDRPARAHPARAPRSPALPPRKRKRPRWPKNSRPRSPASRFFPSP